MKPTIQMDLQGHPELLWRLSGIWNRFEKFCVSRPTIRKRFTVSCKGIGFLKTGTKLHQIRWNQGFRSTYAVILSCFEGAVTFGTPFENFAFAGQLSKNVTGTLKKIGFLKKLTKLHQITSNQLVRCTLEGHPELFWRRCGIWIRFCKFWVCRPTIYKRHWQL